MSSGLEAPVKIRLLGTFEVERRDHVIRADEWSRKKAAALLKRIALENRILKDQAIEFLWPESDPAYGANNLYRTIHSLRQTLNTHLGQDASEAIFRFEDGVLSLDPNVWVDVQEFERLCTAADPSFADLEQALGLYQGDLLHDDLYEEWTLLPRQALYRYQREACLRLSTYYRDTGDYTRAILLITPLLAHDQVDEAVHRELMRLFTLSGQRHEALHQYQACVDALAAEMDVPPSSETTALYEQILSGELTPHPAPAQSPFSPPQPVLLQVERSAPLAGRTAELEQLRAWLHVGQHGQGRTILIGGDSGVGKTRLAYECLHAAAKAGMITLVGAAYEQEGPMAYQPFIEAFIRFLADQRRSPDENPISGFQPRGSDDPQQEQWALFNATEIFLNNLASTLPVVLLLDDLHAADEASLHLFHYLARQTRTAPVVLLATYRSDIGDITGTPFGTLLNALYRERLSETLLLAPLNEDATSRIMAHTLGGMVAQELAKAVFEITVGNPFFVEEMARALHKSNQVELYQEQWRLRPGGELSIPADLAGLLHERTRHLGTSVEDVLAAAAVIGREFRFDILKGVKGTQNLNSLLDALDAALLGHLLEETAVGYRFRHPLIRRALYTTLSQTRRAHLHGQAATAIEAFYERQPRGLEPYIEELAYHYDQSDRRDRALEYLLRAGEKAASVYAFEVAVGYFERALNLMNALGLADPARRWMILEALGWWKIILADTTEGVACFDQALALSPGEGWQPERADRVRLHRGSAVALITAGNTAAAEAHLSAALAEVDEREDAADFARVLYHVAQLHWHRNEFQQAFEVAQRSLAIAERVNDPAAVARAFEMLALACHSLGEWQSGIGYEQQRIALSGPGLDVNEAFDVHL